MKIFAIDDEKASLYFLTKAIAEACPNDEFKTFEDCNEFLESFKSELPDIVFLDVEMPEMTGIELAKKLIEIKSNINIVFATAFSSYALEAFKLNATSYIVKPASKDKVINALSHLRFNPKKEIVIKTFGSFDIFFKDEPIKFRSNKSKEILAYLVDRQGVIVSKKELGGILYEDDYSRSTQAILSRNIQYLQEDLNNAGINDFFYNENGGYWIDLSKTDCDLVKYLEGDHNLFKGEYLEQYEWAEYRKMNFEK